MRTLRVGIKNKILYKVKWSFVKLKKVLFNEKKYSKAYRKLLAEYGMSIAQDESYIDPSAYFDHYDYSLITIGESVTISREVLFLTHDFSISKGLKAINASHNGYLIQPITVGNNCFIGARALLMPGTTIGDNTIIGAGAVVKGNIPKNSIVIGNPCKVIGNLEDYGRKHLEAQDYIKF